MRQTALLILLLSIGVSAQGRDPVAGAWEALPNPNAAAGQASPNPPLHLIYSNGHYVQFTAAANRAKSQKPTAEMTREELLDRLQMQGQYGTYRVEGNKLIRKTIAAAAPNNEGRETTSEFRMEGDILIVTGQNAQGQKTENRYKRLK
jgi:hypothetical protein